MCTSIEDRYIEKKDSAHLVLSNLYLGFGHTQASDRLIISIFVFFLVCGGFIL